VEQAQRERDEAQQERDVANRGGREWNALQTGNASSYTARSPLKIVKHLCSKLHCQKVFPLKLFSYKTVGFLVPLKQVEQAQRERDEAQQERDATNRGGREWEAAGN